MTVRRYLAAADSKSPANPRTDSELEDSKSPTPRTGSLHLGGSDPDSLCEPWKKSIEAVLAAGLSIQRIHQDLVQATLRELRQRPDLPRVIAAVEESQRRKLGGISGSAWRDWGRDLVLYLGQSMPAQVARAGRVGKEELIGVSDWGHIFAFYISNPRSGLLEPIR